MKELKKLPQIIKHCMTIGELPTSYKDSLTYAEQLTWFCHFLEETVIPVVNNNSDAIKELQDFIVNYFNNLDVQEEINNKLEAMAESGELEEIIAEYINSNALICFDTVADLKEATNLVDGSIAKTMGYYNKNDGGSATYKIRTITNEDVVDESFILALDDETLVAEIVIEDGVLYANKLGADNTGINDSSSVINTALEKINSYWLEGKRINTLILEGIYKIDKQIKMPPCAKLKGSGMVKFISNVANDSTILIDYLDNNLPENVELKQRYLSGDMINFESGCIMIYNGDVHDDGAIAIEIGSRVSETTDYNICRYTIKNIAIYNFKIALLHNSYNLFITNYEHLHLESNETNIQFGRTGQDTLNAGEKISFTNCTIAGSTNAILFESINWNIFLNNCSLDFNTNVFKQNVDTLYWNNVQAVECHIESYTNLIVNFRRNQNYININNSIIFNSNNSLTTFVNSDNCRIDLENSHIQYLIDSDETDPEKLINVSTPDSLNLKNTRSLEYNYKSFAYKKNNLVSPLFDSIADGDVNVAWNQNVGNWKVIDNSNVNSTAQVVTDNYLYTGHKSLVISLTDTSADGNLALQSDFIPITTEKLIQNTFYTFNVLSRQCRALITFYDEKKNQISRKATYEYLPIHEQNKWIANAIPNFDVVPTNAKFYKLDITITGIHYDSNYSNAYKIGGLISNAR